MRLLIGQPDAIPLINVPEWQNGMPQSIQRAPCSWSLSSSMWRWNSFQSLIRSSAFLSIGSSLKYSINPVGFPISERNSKAVRPFVYNLKAGYPYFFGLMGQAKLGSILCDEVNCGWAAPFGTCRKTAQTRPLIRKSPVKRPVQRCLPAPRFFRKRPVASVRVGHEGGSASWRSVSLGWGSDLDSIQAPPY